METKEIWYNKDSVSLNCSPIKTKFNNTRYVEYLKYQKAIEVLKNIGSGPGYPLDHCPKCDATHKALLFINKLESSIV